MTIPASDIVQITPEVVGAGGNSLAMNGLILTKNAAVPLGSIKTCSSATDVSNFFGAASIEYAWAQFYFQGRNGATAFPSALKFAQYNTAAVAGYLRGASVAAMTLAALQALSGTLIITVGGVQFSSGTINLAAATSFSNAATIIQAAFTAPTFAVTYDSQRGAFLFTSTATGSAATVTYCTGTLAASLYLTQATGAVLSQGAAAQVPATFMNAVIALDQNWAMFATNWTGDSATALGLAAWNSGQNNRYGYVNWDAEVAALTYPDTTSVQSQIIAANYAGVVGVYADATLDPNGLVAAFVLGCTASIDWNRKNGRITFDFKYLSGVPVSITSQSYATALRQNGFNFIGQWATANQGFSFFNPGQITGSYKFIDEYVNQIFLNSQFQLQLMNLLTSMNSVPYNDAGNTMIASSCQDPINQALNFGSIVPGVALSASQISAVNAAAGTAIDTVLSNRGWYMQVLAPSAQVRAARGTPPINFWYMDGGSVHQISMPSILVQ